MQSFYVGLGSGDFVRTTSCLVPSYPLFTSGQYHVKLMTRCVLSDHGSEIGQFGRFWALRKYNYWTDALKKELAHCQIRVEKIVAFLTWVIWALWLGWASKSESVVLGLPTPLPLHLCAPHISKNVQYYARRKPPKRKALLQVLGEVECSDLDSRQQVLHVIQGCTDRAAEQQNMAQKGGAGLFSGTRVEEQVISPDRFRIGD